MAKVAKITVRVEGNNVIKTFDPCLTVSMDEELETYGDEVRVVKEHCQSTHGGAGYVLGSYRDGDTVICRNCNRRVPYVPGRGL